MMSKNLSGYQIRKCIRSECGLRYPYIDDYTFGTRCPRCAGETTLILRGERHGDGQSEIAAQPGNPIEALLDNIRSAWNVGSMFRTADGAGICRMHLCGITPTPENPDVIKTSLGAEKSIAWSWQADSVITGKRLREEGYQLWALEEDSRSEPMFAMPERGGTKPVVLVVGNEVCGIDPGLLEICEPVFYIPMVGIKRSFNAAVAFGIAAHYLAWNRDN